MSDESLHYRGGGHPVDNTTGDVELITTTTNGNDDAFHDELRDDDKPTTTTTTAAIVGSARTPWYGTTIVLLSEVMGTGILSLPYASRIIGWQSTLVAVPLFAIFASYSGWLLWRVQHERSNLHLHSYAAAAHELVGPKFGRMTEISMLISWGALAIYYMIAAGDGLEDVFFFSGSSLCQYQRTFFVVVLLVLPCQCQDFYSISKYLSLPSTVAVVVSVFIIATNILLLKDNGSTDTAAAETTTTTDTTKSLFDYLMALSSFCFAYQGQSIYLELMSEMKEPRHFPRAINVAYGIMCFFYGFTVWVTYYGISSSSDIPGFLPDILPLNSFSRSVVGALVVLHIAVSYVIAGQPLHKWLHETIFVSSSEPEEGAESKSRRTTWFYVTFGYLIFGWVLSNCIPFFADVQALIGSLFGAPIMFAWPVIFVVAAVATANSTSSYAGLTMMDRTAKNTNNASTIQFWKQGFRQLGWGHASICIVFLVICTPLFCILGTIGAIQSIVEDSEQAAVGPFHCE